MNIDFFGVDFGYNIHLFLSIYFISNFKNMKQIFIFSIVVLFLGAACNNSKQQQTKAEEPEVSNLTSSENKTQSGKVFIVHIDHSMGASICGVKIETKGFSASNETYSLGTIDKVEEVKLADLDNNGFEEIYILTRSAGSGSYSGIYGLASNKDKSATPIYVNPISKKQKKKGGLFEGFMGHNQFVFDADNLLNVFPVYLERDTNSQATGGERKIQYQLIAGEAGWILKADRIIEP